MGMYTELVLAVNFRKDTPALVIDMLKYMVDRTDVPVPALTIVHPFFECERWRSVLTCNSYYFDGFAHSAVQEDPQTGWQLVARANLKNYNQEIDCFLDWIAPYVDERHLAFKGYKRYEENTSPTLIYIGAGKVAFVPVHFEPENYRDGIVLSM